MSWHKDKRIASCNKSANKVTMRAQLHVYPQQLSARQWVRVLQLYVVAAAHLAVLWALWTSRPPLAKETRRLGGAAGGRSTMTSYTRLFIQNFIQCTAFLRISRLSQTTPSYPPYSLLKSVASGQISYFLVCLHLLAYALSGPNYLLITLLICSSLTFSYKHIEQIG